MLFTFIEVYNFLLKYFTSEKGVKRGSDLAYFSVSHSDHFNHGR